MSFVAAIDHPQHLATWSRCCVSLAAISDSLQLTGSAAGLSLKAVNATRTTHGEIHFHPKFFCGLTFSTDHCVPDGFAQRDASGKPCFSVLVAARHLLMLFKNLDASDLNYICLQLDHTASTPPQRLHKLSVEVLTKKHVLKKYSINYHPVVFEASDIPSRYQDLLAQNDIHHFKLETSVLRSFFELVPVAAEDFQIEVKSAKIDFGATTKSASKDSSLAKQPMSITVQMAVEELEDSNLADSVVGIRARLRDVRNFITLISAIRTDPGEDPMGPAPCFESMFLDPGEPIIFQFEAPHIDVCFLQMTVDNTGSFTNKQRYALRGPSISKPEEPILKESRPETESHVFDLISGDPQMVPEPDSYRDSYRKRRLDDDTDYNTSEEEVGYGPTQKNQKPQSLFD